MNRRNYTHKRVKKRRTLRGGSRIKQNTLNKNLVREAMGGAVVMNGLNSLKDGAKKSLRKGKVTGKGF